MKLLTPAERRALKARAHHLQPVMAALREEALPKQVMESVFRDRFATWHGVASGLYVIQSLLGVALVILLTRRK
ncbi:MAG: hypothetical protein Q8L65_07170 [Burkholderiales bacterium]|nr:hypothetical protein [Burkholderiales bacterium]